jgi:cbb3-type cytochrome oxidase subunit 3
MSMSELVSALSPSTFTQIATILFVAVFLTQAARALSRRQRPAHDEAQALPLTDDDRPADGDLS